MRFKLPLLCLATVLTLAGCSTSERSTELEPVQSYNSISGRLGTDGPVLAVKIDDTRSARPQIGVEEADLVYIEQVEGGLTRLAAIFASKIPTNIGPVRSARISDIDILSQFGKVIFAYSGAQRAMLSVIANANLNDYGAQRSSPTIYTRDVSRSAPYDMVLRADLLLAKAQGDNREIALSKSLGWRFGSAPAGGVAIESARISWPVSTYEVTWSESENRWLLSNGGVPNFAASGKQLGAATFVIQNVQISNSIYRSADGGYTPMSETIGAGTGYILRNARAFKANWSRTSAESGTTWTLADGSQINFAAGSIWIALTERKPEFALTERTSPLSK